MSSLTVLPHTIDQISPSSGNLDKVDSNQLGVTPQHQ